MSEIRIVHDATSKTVTVQEMVQGSRLTVAEILANLIVELAINKKCVSAEALERIFEYEYTVYDE